MAATFLSCGKGMSIRLRILLLLVTSLLILGAVFVACAEAVNRDSRRIQLEKVINSLMFESETVNKTIRVLEQSAVDLALAGRVCYLGREKYGDGAVREMVLDNIGEIPEAVGGGIWYEPFAFRSGVKRYCVYACRDGGGKPVFQPAFDGEEYDYPTQSWYVQIRDCLARNLRVGWSETYYDALGTTALMTTVGAGIYDENNRLAGMSTLDWKIQDVVNRLERLCPTPGSFVTLVDPQYTRIVADTRYSGKNPDASSPENYTAALKWFSSLPPQSRQQITVVPIFIGDTKYLSFGRRLDNRMLLLAQVPEHELNTVIEQRNLIALTGGIFLTVMVLLFALWFLTSRFNRPLKKLLAGVGSLSRGKLDTVLEVRGHDEIALLSAAFNRMTSNLKKRIEHLKTVTAAKEKIESELKVAKEIQMGILPKILPPFPKCDYFEIDAFLAPAREVGGDLYDFFLLSPTKICLVIGDVSGKGIPASLFMAVTQTLHRGLAHEADINPETLVVKMNQALCNNNNAGFFVTYFFAVLDLETGILSYCNAGHNPFFVLKHDGTVCEPAVRHGIPLGVRLNRPYGESDLRLEIGDTLFLYTDGVPETINATGEFFGKERLKSLLEDAAAKRLSPREIDQSLRDALSAFAGGAEQFDDITILSIRVIAFARPAGMEQPQNGEQP